MISHRSWQVQDRRQYRIVAETSKEGRVSGDEASKRC